MVAMSSDCPARSPLATRDSGVVKMQLVLLRGWIFYFNQFKLKEPKVVAGFHMGSHRFRTANHKPWGWTGPHKWFSPVPPGAG